MSPRATRWTLWGVLFCVAPVPYMLGGLETAPALRLLFFTALIVTVQIAEGSGGFVWNTFILLGAVQSALYAAGLYLCAALVTRAVTRLAPRRRLIAVAAIAAAMIGTAIALPLYDTPMSSRTMHSTLFGVFQ